MTTARPAGLHLHRVKLTLHSWELPSWPLGHLRSATAGALRAAISHFYPEVSERIEIAYNAAPEETVLNPQTAVPTVRGAKLELDIRGGTEHERHMYQHTLANSIEGIMRQTLQKFIEHDAVSRYHQLKNAYKTYSDVDDPVASGRILT